MTKQILQISLATVRILIYLSQMLSLDQGSQISEFVQQTVLSWVKLYPSFENTKQIIQLTNGNFFLLVLQSLSNFKLLSPIYQLGEEYTLGAKVNIIKNISKSLIKYHQTQLLRDVSELDINYVQLCMGNKKQLFRLITMLLSALYSQTSSRQVLDQKIQQLNTDQAQVLKIMIDNSLNIGQECGSCSSRSWRLSEQKKVFAKMQLLQNKIEQLQIINHNLEQLLKTQKQCQQATAQQNKKLKQQIKRILILNDQLAQTNQKRTNQLKLSTIQQCTTKKKFQLMKTKLQQKIQKLQTTITKLYNERQQTTTLLQKITHITQINKEIKQQNQKLREIITKLQAQKIENKKIQKIHNQQFIALKQHCCQLEVKIQELSLACSIKSQTNQNNYRTCYFGNKIEDDAVDSNIYRVKQNLNWLNNHHVYNIDEQSQSLNMMRNGSYNQDRDRNKFQIRTITERSLQDSVCLSQIKQNQSIIMNNSQIMQSFHNRDQNKFQRLSNSLQGAIEKQEYNKIKKQIQQKYIQQIKILTCVILDLQAQLDQARKTNHNVYFNNDSLTISRMQKFKTKVKEMFGKNGQNLNIR